MTSKVAGDVKDWVGKYRRKYSLSEVMFVLEYDGAYTSPLSESLQECFGEVHGVQQGGATFRFF